MTKSEIKIITDKYLINKGFVRDEYGYVYGFERFNIVVVFDHSPHDKSYEIYIYFEILNLAPIDKQAGRYGGDSRAFLRDGTTYFYYQDLNTEKYIAYLDEIYETNLMPFIVQGESHVKYQVERYKKMIALKIEPTDGLVFSIHPRAIEEIEKW